MLQALRPIPMAYWSMLVWYITSCKAYLQEERRLKQLGHLCICLCFLSLSVIFLTHEQISAKFGRGIQVHIIILPQVFSK